MQKPSQPSYRVAQWLQIPILLDDEEMRSFIACFPLLQLYQVGVVYPKDRIGFSKEDFIRAYDIYISALKKGETPDPNLYKDLFAGAFSSSPDDFISLDLPENRRLLRVHRPVIQLQEHRIDFSSHDQEFRSKVLGPKSILWGIQISYPQLYENPSNKQPQKVLNNPLYPNGSYFRQMQRWMRDHTLPTPFIVDGKRKNVPIRLGKKCFSWINNHPGLRERQLRVLS